MIALGTKVRVLDHSFVREYCSNWYHVGDVGVVALNIRDIAEGPLVDFNGQGNSVVHEDGQWWVGMADLEVVE